MYKKIKFFVYMFSTIVVPYNLGSSLKYWLSTHYSRLVR